MPRRRLFVGVRNLKQLPFRPPSPDNLKPHRQAVFRESTRHRDGGQSEQIEDSRVLS